MSQVLLPGVDASSEDDAINDLVKVEALLVTAAYEFGAMHMATLETRCNDAAYLIAKTVIPTNQQFKTLEAELAASENAIDALAAELGVTIDIGMAAVDVKSLLLEAIDGLKAEIESLKMENDELCMAAEES